MIKLGAVIVSNMSLIQCDYSNRLIVIMLSGAGSLVYAVGRVITDRVLVNVGVFLEHSSKK